MKVLNKIFHEQKIMGITLLILLALCLSCRAVPQWTDINWQTILSLFSLMLVTQYLIKNKVLAYLSQKIIIIAQTQRQVTQLLVLLAGLLAMFLTNDVAILSLVPLFLAIHKQVHGPFVRPLSLITISANLGSAFTPFGNPQNLYLFNHYHLSTGAFFKMSAPLTIISVVLLFISTWSVPAKPLPHFNNKNYLPKKSSLITALCLLGVVILGVLHFIPLIYSTLISLIIILLLDKSIITKVDYGTLITFIGFFLIVGILGRQNYVIRLVTYFLRQGTIATYWTSILLSQLISNVPATFLIARFSTNIAAIFFGVNVGGLGTPVASFANLLALKQAHVSKLKILAGFLTINLVFLLVLAIATLTVLP